MRHDTASRRQGAGRRSLYLSAIAVGVFTGFLAPAAEADVTGKQVTAAIVRGVNHIKGKQAADGTWPDYSVEGGTTALAVYALVTAGVSPDDPAVTKGLAALKKVPDVKTYAVALKTLAFSAAAPKTYRGRIQDLADWLVESQKATGGWGYGKPPRGGAFRVRRMYERTDGSNTQFALLALDAARRAGAGVPKSTWTKAERYLLSTQLPGGGWGYTYQGGDPENAYGSMTAATLAGLYLCHDNLGSRGRPDKRLVAAEGGVEWIARKFALKRNPGRGLAWYYFWLYSLERVGVASGRARFGDHDWYREGAELLVGGQQRDGSWTPRLYQNCLCLLFLAKGHRPLLVQRMAWGQGWRQDPRDLDHLVAYLDDRVGDEPVAWQVVDDEASLEAYLAAPILHVSGRGALRMLVGARPRLVEYVEQGGLILFDAVGGDETFVDSVRRLAADLWDGAEFKPLAGGHPIYTLRHRVGGPRLEALNIGCRSAVLLAPDGLGDEWAAGHPDSPGPALELGENLAVYATAGTNLAGRLESAEVVEMPKVGPPERGVDRIGQIVHAGDWHPRPLALPRLLKQLSERFGMTVHGRPVPVKLADDDTEAPLENIAGFPMLRLVGHEDPGLSDAEKRALKAYLERGGFLWAEACCGRREFDKAFRGLVAEILPKATLEKLPPDHAIFDGKPGYRIERVTYTEAVREESPELVRPVLYGVKLDGHLVAVYSPYAIGPGLDGIRTWGSRGYGAADAARVAVNIVLYGVARAK